MTRVVRVEEKAETDEEEEEEEEEEEAKATTRNHIFDTVRHHNPAPGWSVGACSAWVRYGVFQVWDFTGIDGTR